MICLYCHKSLDARPDIFSLFKKPNCVCVGCINKLKSKTSQPTCLRCHNITHTPTDECESCSLLKQIFEHVPGRIFSFLEYNVDVAQLIHRYKFVNDAALSEVIASLIDFDFSRYDIVIPIPISKYRLKERTYNQTSLVLAKLSVPYQDILETTRVARQSELTKAERLLSKGIFKVKPEAQEMLFDKKVLLVDDVYTTGITVHQALQTIKKHTSENIDVLTFSRS